MYLKRNMLLTAGADKACVCVNGREGIFNGIDGRAIWPNPYELGWAMLPETGSSVLFHSACVVVARTKPSLELTFLVEFDRERLPSPDSQCGGVLTV